MTAPGPVDDHDYCPACDVHSILCWCFPPQPDSGETVCRGHGPQTNSGPGGFPKPETVTGQLDQGPTPGVIRLDGDNIIKPWYLKGP